MPQNDIFQKIIEMRSGVSVNINEKFNELVDAVLEVRAKGKLTIEINVAPQKVSKQGNVVEVTMHHTIKMVKPEEKPSATTFFVNDEGRLMREDPAQEKLFSSSVEDAKGVTLTRVKQ